MPDISAPGAVFMLSIPGLLPVAQRVQGFAVEDSFDFDDVDAGETLMGNDGILSSGMVFAKKPMTIALQADSVSIPLFETWFYAEQVGQLRFSAQATASFPNLLVSYNLVTGFLMRLKPAPDVKKTLMPRRFRIEWQGITSAPIPSTG